MRDDKVQTSRETIEPFTISQADDHIGLSVCFQCESWDSRGMRMTKGRQDGCQTRNVRDFFIHSSGFFPLTPPLALLSELGIGSMHWE